MTQVLEIGLAPADQPAVARVGCAPGACGSEASPRDPEPALALLQAVADPVRWTVMERLADGTHCVCDLRAHVDVSDTLLSYHLRILRDAGLVTTARRGRWVDYTLAPDAPARLAQALPAASSLVPRDPATAASSLAPASSVASQDPASATPSGGSEATA
ncbi:helix-turn-helix transcriptional regulator [Demequina sp. NBRC 110054]|uniref:ArsR/SmtB family transcription factor n=1 Tax=Demequina sp. NBRC 110054 TaxID=1570343 RepID=UPI001F2772DB|nr:metalloregulator ArsR/SmtB family transcription factor [Demequina sp. NBRC 110054]